MWHRIAPRMAQRFSLVMPDLRGYGQSSAPRNDPKNEAYSKRTMASDMVAVMAALGHRRFSIAGHDRGGRVAYRMALDHSDRVTRLCVLDIVPTFTMWRSMSAAAAMKIYHWPFLAQPYPLPERLISADPAFYVDWTIASWTRDKNLAAFDPAALAAYRNAMSEPERLHAACNDYRAGATIDLAHDEQDHAASHMIDCPTLALWGNSGIPGGTTSPLKVWREWCAEVEGFGIDAGHFIAEENPDATAAALLRFLDSE